MNPNLLDHLYVVLVLLLIFPIGGWWSYRRFLERIARDGDAALVREYRVTLVWLLGLGLSALGLWVWAGRPLASLGFAPLRDTDFALPVTIGLAIGLLARPLLAATSTKAAAALRTQFASLEAFLPKTGEQLAWGLAASIFAGIFEEIAYRGFLIAYLGTWLSPAGAIIASGLLFGLAHAYQGKAGVIGTAILGVGLGWIYVETGSLLLPVLLHAAIDISSMVTAYLLLRPGVEPPADRTTASRSAPGRS